MGQTSGGEETINIWMKDVENGAARQKAGGKMPVRMQGRSEGGHEMKNGHSRNHLS